MSKRVDFFFRAAPGLSHRRLVINRHPGAGESVGAPVIDVTLGAEEVSFSCVLPENRMWQAQLVDSKPSGTRSTHALVFNTATNRRVDPKDEAHSSTFRLSFIQDVVEDAAAPAKPAPVVVDLPPAAPEPTAEPLVATEAASIDAAPDEVAESDEESDEALTNDDTDHVDASADPSDDVAPSDI